MNFKINNKRSRSKAIPLILILALAFILAAAPGASVTSGKCSDCHLEGVKAAKASDTIAVENSTCFKCHVPKYPLEYKNLDLHSIHSSTPGQRSDYLERHPMENAQECGKCHSGTAQCTYCHAKHISHSGGRLDCATCHGSTTDLFKHPEIKLDKHNFPKAANETACSVCHDTNRDYLILLNKAKVPVSEPHRLCYQCHSGIYNDWVQGMHFANRTSAAGKQHYVETGMEESWEKQNTCTICHDAHDTKKMFWSPPAQTPTPEKAEKSSSAPLTHIAVILASSMAVIAAYFIRIKIKR